ncbi:hypothetical protein CHS0354_005294 [Potamilus streckersoni]|uniref:AAA+ ATPase domain-containing protein n=1 Tax=Potamilus streckersoni TaxID=2493646 RepID=A0AAE0SGR4_9BIVA|nr:hypothetical protein CHS0354_005294 [Potamilus streckersoni]
MGFGDSQKVSTALSQVYNVINSMRQGGLGCIFSAKRHQHAVRSQRNRGARQIISAETDVNQLKEKLSIEHLVSDLRLEELCPLLHSITGKDSCSGTIPSPWVTLSSSADTFFENRTGFPASELETDVRQLGHLTRLGGERQFQQFLHTAFNNMFLQQRRGFKTERADRSTGIGKRSSKKLSAKSIFDYIGLGKDKSSAGNNMDKFYKEYENNPEFREKLQLAFAEGYQANRPNVPQKPKWREYLRIFFIVFFLVYLYRILTDTTSGIGRIGGVGILSSEKFEINAENISVTFKDVKGVDEPKQELEEVVQYLRDPKRFKALGAKLPKGVLLVGPPGTGKTLLARAVAGEAGVPFFYAAGSEFDELFVGLGAKRVRQMFTAAKARSPCVIFIDEIDSVGAKRTSSQIHPYANQTINQLLAEMDGFTQNEGIIVIGATNKKGNLDKALLRPGRFDVEVQVYMPDLKGRKETLTYYLSKVTASPEVDIDKFAQSTTGFTGADIENLVNQAALKAAKDGAKLVDNFHLEFARDKVIMGPAKMSKISDQKVNWTTAYHEAGHAVVAYFTKDALPIHKVTIIPRGMSLGHTSFIPEKEIYGKSKAELLSEMDVSMGGRAAEEIIYGPDNVTTGASSDFGKATDIATAMVKLYGMSEKAGVRLYISRDLGDGINFTQDISPAAQEIVDSEIKRLLQESYERAKQLLKTHSKEHKLLAKALMKYETLSKEEVQTLFDQGKLDKKV